MNLVSGIWYLVSEICYLKSEISDLRYQISDTRYQTNGHYRDMPTPWTSRSRCRAAQRPRRKGRRAAVLLEVILALALFVGTSGIVLASLSACVRSAREIRLEAQAADLAVTRLSEIQMGLLPIQDSSAEPFDPPFDAWTWQAATMPVIDNGEDMGLKKIEIVVTQTEQGFVYRLSALLVDQVQAAGTADQASAAAGGGP